MKQRRNIPKPPAEQLTEQPAVRFHWVPMHWFMLLSVSLTAAIVISGIVAISGDLRIALDLGSRNRDDLNRSAGKLDRLFSVQFSFRKRVEEQLILVNRFAYEFDLFVAREEPDISALKTAFSRMTANYKILEKNAEPTISKAILQPLKENINMAIGIFEEAAEFETVGFGEIYRLAEDSKEAVDTLVSAMNQLEIILDRRFMEASEEVILNVHLTNDNARNMFLTLEKMTVRNQTALWLLLFFTIFFQALFFYLFRKRISNFSRLTRYITLHGDLSRRIPKDSDDDLGRLAASFNDMLDSLELTTMSKKFLDDILESMDDAVLVLSSQGRIEKVNSHACLLTNQSVSALINTSVYGLFKTDVPELVRAISAGEHKGPVEFVLSSDQDPNPVVLVSVTPLLVVSEMRGTGKHLCVIRDISLIKEMEAQKIHAEKIALEKSKYALIGQIAGKMAHDFNNVLGIIMGNAELSMFDCPEGELKKTLELIYKQTIRGKNLTKNLVAFAKDQEPNQEFFPITRTVDLVIQLLKKDLGKIRIARNDAPGLPEIYADPGMVEHSLVNLLQNAVHALSKTPDPCIQIRTCSRNNQLCLSVEDNGCGILPDCHGRVFEPSFTLKGSKDNLNVYDAEIKGTGYGLANVKKYIDQHQGTIIVKNNSGRGTTFSICLPIVKKSSEPEKITSRGELPLIKEKQILLVEDEKAMLDVQFRLLTHSPYCHQVSVAKCAGDAVALFDSNDFHLVSLDYILEDGSNGMDVYTHIRAKNKFIPILFVSGNIEFLESVNVLKQEDPLMDHLSKPCRGEEYLKEVTRLLLKSSATE